MRFSNVVALGAVVMVSAAPLEERADLPGSFAITNFSYGCTTTCDWSFDVTVGPKYANHPAVKKAVHCSGSTDITEFQDGTCGDISATQSIRAYIGPKNRLKLEYEVVQPKKGARYWYSGGKKVNAETSGKPQAKSFSIKETKATAIA